LANGVWQTARRFVEFSVIFYVINFVNVDAQMLVNLNGECFAGMFSLIENI
jgi:hypothetical protein